MSAVASQNFEVFVDDGTVAHRGVTTRRRRKAAQLAAATAASSKLSSQPFEVRAHLQPETRILCEHEFNSKQGSVANSVQKRRVSLVLSEKNAELYRDRKRMGVSPPPEDHQLPRVARKDPVEEDCGSHMSDDQVLTITKSKSTSSDENSMNVANVQSVQNVNVSPAKMDQHPRIEKSSSLHNESLSSHNSSRFEISILEEDEAEEIAPTICLAPNVPKCDIKNARNDLYFVEYVNDIMSYLRERESHHPPVSNYMDGQPDISPRMRTILIDWLIEVHDKFQLRPKTLYLTVSTIDRFLSKRSISRTKLQLIGCAAMMLASKFEEIYPPEVRDFVYIADSAFTRAELLKMEKIVISELSWQLSTVSVLDFSSRNLQISDASPFEQHLTAYIIELTLVEYRMLRYLPSKMAASALFLAFQLSPSRPSRENLHWTEEIEYHTGYSSDDLAPCVADLVDMLTLRNPKERSIRRKFSKSKRLCVSKHSLRELMKNNLV